MENIEKYEKLIPIIEDKIRVLKLELVKEADVAGFWMYHIVFVEKDKIKEDEIMGKDMSDALYRYSQVISLPQSRFISKYFKS